VFKNISLGQHIQQSLYHWKAIKILIAAVIRQKNQFSISFILNSILSLIFRQQNFALNIIALIAIGLCSISSTEAEAAKVTLAWNRTKPAPSGYKVFLRTAVTQYDYRNPEWVGSKPTTTIYNLANDTTYYFVVRSFIGDKESSDSNEVYFQSDAVNISLAPAAVTNNTTLVIDNGDKGTYSKGAWKRSTSPSAYGSQSLYSKAKGSRYTFVSQITGHYEISLWWTADSSRCSSVPVKIYDGNQLLDTVIVNQRRNGGLWYVLGSYDFFDRARVVIKSRNNRCTTNVDAIEFSEDDDDSRIVDNSTRGTSSSGTWKVSNGNLPYGSQSLFTKIKGASYTFTSRLTGRNKVYLWWTKHNSRCTRIPVTIYSDGVEIDTVYVNQRQNGSRWNLLGSYYFRGQASVNIQSVRNNCTTCADAVLFSK
jgi:hypothetical protein